MGYVRHCAAVVYAKDTLRRTGRGPTGFEMHYIRRECSRPVPEGEHYCWQHRKGQVDG